MVKLVPMFDVTVIDSAPLVALLVSAITTMWVSLAETMVSTATPASAT